MPKIRILLVDDHDLTRKGLRRVLESVADFTIIKDEASDGEEAVKLVLKHLPDVAIIDVIMPEIDGIEATKRISVLAPSVKVIGISGFSDKEYLRGMFGAGAIGYLDKSCTPEEIVRVVREAAKGNPCFCAKVLKSIFKDYKSLFINVIDNAPTTDSKNLTKRQHQVAVLFSKGKKTDEIADELKLSRHTIKAHCRDIAKKLGLSSIKEIRKRIFR